jgi:general secretion pathway protein B
VPGAPPVAAPVAPAAPTAPAVPLAPGAAPAPGSPATPAPPQGTAQLTLDVLVYADDEARRFVFINGRKYVEGETVEGGALLERITRDGAVLRDQGRVVVLRPRLNPYSR